MKTLALFMGECNEEDQEWFKKHRDDWMTDDQFLSWLFMFFIFFFFFLWFWYCFFLICPSCFVGFVFYLFSFYFSFSSL